MDDEANGNAKKKQKRKGERRQKMVLLIIPVARNTYVLDRITRGIRWHDLASRTTSVTLLSTITRSTRAECTSSPCFRSSYIFYVAWVSAVLVLY
jgi:hypothetical protein